MSEDGGLLSVLEFKSSEGVYSMAGVTSRSGEPVALAACVSRVALRSVRESRGVATGVRRGGSCSSSS